MTRFAPWQRVTYYSGEVLLFGGLLWALYERFFAGGPGCPLVHAGLLQPFTLIVAGIALDTLPLHPFGTAPYLRKGLGGTVAGMIWWLLALLGVAFAFYAVVTAAAPPTWWLAALVPAFLWYWAAIVSRNDGKSAPPTKAPPAPRNAKAQPERRRADVEAAGASENDMSDEEEHSESR